jgi:hypothetical protein
MAIETGDTVVLLIDVIDWGYDLRAGSLVEVVGSDDMGSHLLRVRPERAVAHHWFYVLRSQVAEISTVGEAT